MQINGNWYHIDCTWDDPVGNSGYWGKTTPTKWFMKSDSYMLRTYSNGGKLHHAWVPNTYACNDTSYDSWSDGMWVQWEGTWSRSTPTGYSLPSSVSMTTDAQKKLTISNLTPSNAPLTDANWSSSNSVVSVSTNGIVTSGKSAGISTVTCNIWGVKRSTKVYVYGGSLSGSGITVTLSPTSYNYDGKAKKPSVKVTHKTSTGTLTLRSGTDYSVSYSNNTGPGTATVTITGKGSYSGSVKKTFIIYGNVSNATVSGVSNKTYQGKAVTQSPTVKVNGKTLKAGTDYTISYQNNNKVGTATMIITGKGVYKGTKKVTFKIIQNVPKWQRYGGKTALDTAKLVVEADNVFKAGRGDMVIVATNNGYWDALAASALAGVFDAPVLITNGSRLSSQTRAEIQRFKATRVIIVGGAAAVSDNVARELNSLTGSVYRVAGKNAVGTANAIFSEWNGYWSKTAIVATSTGYWDALAIAPYAFKAKAPIFLTGSGNKLTSDTVSAIRSGNFNRVVIVGGKAAVSGSVESQLKGAGVSSVVRLSGKTALDTSAEIAKWEIKQGMGVSHLTLATSNGYWDALTGAAVCGKLNSVLVLVSSGGDTRAFKAVYDKNKVTHGHILGGNAAVPASVERYVKSR